MLVEQTGGYSKQACKQVSQQESGPESYLVLMSNRGTRWSVESKVETSHHLCREQGNAYYDKRETELV